MLDMVGNLAQCYPLVFDTLTAELYTRGRNGLKSYNVLCFASLCFGSEDLVLFWIPVYYRLGLMYNRLRVNKIELRKCIHIS